MYRNLEDFFPWGAHSRMRNAQSEALGAITKAGTGQPVILQAPTGVGKMAIGITYLNAHGDMGKKHRFLLEPNKALVEQAQVNYPNVKVAYGRNEHPCLYPKYEGQNLRADEIPCLMLMDCPHRVDQETGKTHTKGVAPCPYYQQKFEAKNASGPIAASYAFFLYTVLFSKEFEPGAVAIDEADRLAQAMRSVLQTELTDWMLTRAVEALNTLGSRQVVPLSNFLQKMKGLVKSRALGHETLLEDEEIEELYRALMKVSVGTLQQETRRAVRDGHFDVDEDRLVLKQLEDIARAVRRFQHALKYATELEGHKPLNYVLAFGKKELGERERVQYKIVVKDYFVVPLIRKMLPPDTLAMSATIGDPRMFQFETGIRGTFVDIKSEFPVDNARIYLPTDARNLAHSKARRGDKNKTLRLIVSTAKQFARKGIRSLVLVVSNDERAKVHMFASEGGLKTLTYNPELPPRECVKRFRDGEGECLLGTSAIFGVGLDLPDGLAPVTFVLRPGFPRLDDPQAIFEERRFTDSQKWSLWQYRVMVEMLQSRGRNIRSVSDKGVTFLMSAQYRKFAFGALPKYLQPTYRGMWNFDKCVEDAMKLLN